MVLVWAWPMEPLQTIDNKVDGFSGCSNVRVPGNKGETRNFCECKSLRLRGYSIHFCMPIY